MLPHEKVGLVPVIDTIPESGKISQRYHFKRQL